VLPSDQDTTEVTSMTLSESGVLAVFTRSLALRFYTIPPSLDHSLPSEGASISTVPTEAPLLPLIRHTPRSHPAPVLVSTIDPTSTLLASGSADGLVKVWDLAGGFVTHVFRSHGGPISAMCFNLPRFGPAKGSRMELITGCADTKVRVFDLRDVGAGGKPRAVIEGHVSVVRGLGVTDEGRWLVSGGRDKVLMVWDLWGGDEKGWERLASAVGGAGAASKKKGKSKAIEVQLVRTITVLESLESVGVLGQEEEVSGLEGPIGDRVVCWSAGEKGIVRAWDALHGTQLATFRGAEGVNAAGVEELDEDEQRGIVFVS
jgi:U3 small nucleolar RNA-associated protein 13